MIYSIPNIKSFVSRPTVVYQNVKLSESTSSLVHELDSENLYKGLHEVYPEATLVDLFEWVDFFSSHNVLFDKAALASSYSFFWSESTESLYQQSLIWHGSFKLWCKNKKAHVNDLRPLCLLDQFNSKDKNIIFDFINHFDSLRLSLSDGKKILELFVDIIGSNPVEYSKLGEELIELKLSSEQILRKLHKIKYPVSSKKDEKKQTFVKNTAWPQNTKVNFLRQGDQAGFELSVFVHQSEYKEKYLKVLKESLDKIDHYLVNQNSEPKA